MPFESFDQLQSIIVPTLVVGNYKDPVHLFGYAGGLAAAIRSAALREIPSESASVDGHRHSFRHFLSQFLSSVS